MQNPIGKADLEWILHRNCEGTEQLRNTKRKIRITAKQKDQKRTSHYQIRKQIRHKIYRQWQKENHCLPYIRRITSTAESEVQNEICSNNGRNESV